MHMTARKTFVYAGRRLHPGDTFETRGHTDARVLTAVGHAVEAPAPQPVAPAQQAAVRVAGLVASGAIDRKPATRSRTYARRDLTAETPNIPPAPRSLPPAAASAAGVGADVGRLGNATACGGRDLEREDTFVSDGWNACPQE